MSFMIWSIEDWMALMPCLLCKALKRQNYIIKSLKDSRRIYLRKNDWMWLLFIALLLMKNRGQLGKYQKRILMFQPWTQQQKSFWIRSLLIIMVALKQIFLLMGMVFKTIIRTCHLKLRINKLICLLLWGCF